jgi:hypothetical protein
MKPAIIGDESVTSRIHVLTQPESPVEVFAVDFTRMRFLTGGGWFTLAGPYTFDVLNRSTVAVKEIRPLVFVRTQDGGGGGGLHWKGTLSPGATVRIYGRHDGQGTAPNDVAMILVGIRAAGCEGSNYSPSALLKAHGVPPLAGHRAP